MVPSCTEGASVEGGSISSHCGDGSSASVASGPPSAERSGISAPDGRDRPGDESWGVDRGGPAGPGSFTLDENPFLYPAALLDPWAASAGFTSPAAADANGRSLDTQSDPDRARWWLVHTKPRQEKKLAEQLGASDIPHYLPVTKCKAQTRGRTRVTRQPQFPSYLFLWADGPQRRKTLETNRVVATHFVDDQARLGGQLWELADLIEKGVPLRLEERLAPGQLVRVVAGVLRDKCGSVIKRGGKTRLFIFISELLGGVSVEVEQHLLEPY